MNLLTSLPLRFSVPAILGAAVLAVVATQTLIARRAADIEVERNAADIGMQDMAEWQGVLDHLLAKGETEVVETMISGYGSNLYVVTSVICDERGTVLFSTRRDWIGDPGLSVVPGLTQSLLSSVTSDLATRAVLSPDRLSMYLCAPVVLDERRAELRSSRVGTLWSHYDLSRRKAIRRSEIDKLAVRSGAGILAIFAAVVAVLHVVLSKRIGRLVSAADRIAKGDLSARAGLHGGDEVAQVGAVFDDMASQIARDRGTLEERVALRTTELTASNRELESFSYSVSHDLRAPIRGIDGFAAMLERRATGRLDDEDRRLLRVIRANAHRMGKLIDDLLAFSRLGRTDVHRVPVDMRTLAESTWAEVVQTRENGPPAFSAGPLPQAEGDLEMLRLVWKNLLENSVKFTAGRPAPVVEVGWQDEPEGAWFVRDNGVGFEMKYAGKLFGVFQRLQADPAFPGTGVGLAIVHRIVTRHGGRVWAEAVPGEGATFYFSLPSDAR